jgi:hypothetical protein
MDDTIDQEPIDYHRLAVIFALCACATVLDPDLNYGNPQAEYFSQLARAAFFSGHAAEYPTIDGIQALVRLSYFFPFEGQMLNSMRLVVNGNIFTLS